MLLGVTVVTFTPSLAQSVSHDVSVEIPNSIGIRVVGVGAGTRGVDFDYAIDVAAYVAAAETGERLQPTLVTRFDDIEVNVSGFGFWSLFFEATPFAYVGSGNGTGLALADVRIDRGSASGLTQDAITIHWLLGRYDTSWTLAASPQQIARTWLPTGGWRSLGFNGWDYSLAVDGDEDAGTYTTSVTYYLTFP